LRAVGTPTAFVFKNEFSSLVIHGARPFENSRADSDETRLSQVAVRWEVSKVLELNIGFERTEVEPLSNSLNRIVKVNQVLVRAVICVKGVVCGASVW
jgi:hypothetical protein